MPQVSNTPIVTFLSRSTVKREKFKQQGIPAIAAMAGVIGMG
jgi:hypothetical protein